MQDFIDNLKDAVENFEDIEISANTNFKALSTWDSIALISIMAVVSANYSVALAAEDILNATTIEDLWNKIQSKK